MSCAPFDLKGYFLKEMPEPQRRQTEEHVRQCQACREELDRLRLTEAALFALREEEIPQRIAFVSDQVFEPSAWRRWWTTFWGSPARLGFASAAMLSMAILVFAVARTSGPSAVRGRPVVTAAMSEADVQARIQAAVDKAVHESEGRLAERTEKLVADFLDRQRKDSEMMALAADRFQYLERQLGSEAVPAYRQTSPRGVAQ
jgi:anti-sigma factor RsiW